MFIQARYNGWSSTSFRFSDFNFRRPSRGLHEILQMKSFRLNDVRYLIRQIEAFRKAVIEVYHLQRNAQLARDNLNGIPSDIIIISDIHQLSEFIFSKKGEVHLTSPHRSARQGNMFVVG